MACNWELTTVEDLVRRGILERPLDGNHGEIHPKGGDFVSSGVPFIMASDLVNGGVDTRNCSFISHQQAKTLRKGFSKQGDVLLSHKATLGRTAIVGDIPTDFVVLTPQVTYYRIKNPVKLNNRFLKYYFDSKPFQQVLESWAGSGSTRAYIGITDQLRLPVCLPPISEQKRIADILGSLDDKIELNRKTNETLEAMARAIFKSWFVDFDPVVAKSEGRQTEGMDAETAKLFPDSFEDSEIGRIPKGWRVGSINDLATLSRDTITPSQNPNEVFDHYSIPAFDEGRLPKTEMGNAIMSNKFTVHDNSVLLSKLNPRIPRVWMPDSLGNKRALCSTEFLVSIPKANVSKEYLYLLFTSAQFCERFATFVTGTSGSHQRVKPDSLLTIESPLPPDKLTKAFTALVSPLLLAVSANIRQSRILSEMRDVLLPRLLSGEIVLPLKIPPTEG